MCASLVISPRKDVAEPTTITYDRCLQYDPEQVRIVRAPPASLYNSTATLHGTWKRCYSL